MKNILNSVWDYLSMPGVISSLQPPLRRRVILTNQISAIAVLLSIVYLAIYWVNGWQTSNVIVFTSAIAFVLCPVLNNLRLYNLSRIAIILIASTEIFLFSSIFGKEAGLHLFFFPLLVLIFSLFDFKEKLFILSTIVSCSIFILCLELTEYDILARETPPFNVALLYSLSWIFSFLFLVVTFYMFLIANNAASKHISATENLSQLINAMPNPTFIKDKHEQFFIANEAYLSLFNTDEKMDEDSTEIQLKHKDGAIKTLVPKKVIFTDQSGEELVAGSLLDITDIKQAQEKISHIENLLKEAQENAHIGSWEHDIYTGETVWSDEARRILGLNKFPEYTLKELIQRVHPEDAEMHKALFQDYLKEGKSFQLEERILLSEGSMRHVYAVGKAIVDEYGKISRLIGSVIDISERKQAEIALTDYKKLFGALVEHSSDITSIIDMQGNFVYQSPSFYKEFGYEDKEVLNESIFEFIHPEDRSDFIRLFSKILQSPGVPFTTELRLQMASGYWVVLEAIFTNLIDDEAVGGIIINSKDITERKNAEVENTDKSQMLKGITSNMPVIIYKIDENGVFKEAVGEGLRKLGIKEGQLKGKKAVEFYPQNKEEIQTAFHGDQVSFVHHGKYRNKPFYFENYIFPDSARKGGLIGFALDITDKKQAEIRQQEHWAELEKINNNLDQFAYIVSHDLKAPLRAISHLVEWIEEDIKDKLTNESIRNMTLLKERVQKMQALIKGILEYAKVSQLNNNCEEVNINSLVREVVNLIGVPSKFDVKYSSKFPTIVNSKVAIEQIFSNLISNAVKYHNKPEGVILIGYNEKDKFHEFFVADDGPGILKDYHSKIFEIFQTLQSKEKVDSTGIGLAIVKKVIEEQGGSIWVESDHGKGAKFCFTVPKKGKKLKSV